MQSATLDDSPRLQVFSRLADMSQYLQRQFAGLTDEQAAYSTKEGSYSALEHVWHLADLEREGFGLRINRLLSENKPFLSNFDGTAVALERDYKKRSLQEGLNAFAEARTANLTLMKSLTAEAWAREGTLEGVGAITLCDLPQLMSQHDDIHRAEIETLGAALTKRSLNRDTQTKLTRTNQIEWKPLNEPGVTGVYVKVLLYDEQTHRAPTIMLKFDAGATYPAHNHPAGEEVFVLEGDIKLGKDHLFAGDYLYTPPGGIHAVWSKGGCVVLLKAPEEVEILKPR